MKRPAGIVEPESDARRLALLEAAIGVFTRFGYRKTSMDEVARAAGISRQGLYLHFASKEDLFRAAVVHVYESALEAARRVLADGSLSLEARLVGAVDAWTGPYVGMASPTSAELDEVASRLVGSLVAEREAQLVETLAVAIRRAGLAAAYRPVKLTARQLAETLYATARGLKSHSESRADFVRGLTIAVRALAAPLAPRRGVPS